MSKPAQPEARGLVNALQTWLFVFVGFFTVGAVEHFATRPGADALAGDLLMWTVLATLVSGLMAVLRHAG